MQRKILRDTDMQKNPVTHNQQILLLQELLRTVALQGYRFTTVTPLTHQRLLASSNGIAKNIRDIFGWNLLFKSNLLPPLVFELMSQADLLINTNGFFQSKIRISSLNDDLFLHSRFPTDDEHAVFFGPDTYRFSRFIQHSLKVLQFESGFTPNGPLQLLDVGCGSGAGGIAAIRALQNQHQYLLTLNDLNPVALDYATACAQVAAVSATILPGDFFNVQHKQFDLILCNPPIFATPQHVSIAMEDRSSGWNLVSELQSTHLVYYHRVVVYFFTLA